ncbi:MAG: insulinase family protein [Deltaproteobacteria bacterium]|nr:insulinase family protein [Deltaproteobacteria bacterium]
MKTLALAFAATALTACGGSGKKDTVPAPLPTENDIVKAQKPEVPVEPPTVTQTARPQQLAFPDEDFRAAQPPPGAARPFKLPKVQTFTLASGTKVYLVEQHALPIVSMDLNFDGGSLFDPKGKDGLASVCMAMLTEGTEKLDKIQYAEALADVASSVGSYATDDAAGLTLSSLSKHLDATFALFADALRSPGFRASDFDRMIKRRIEAVRQSRGNPASVAARVTGTVLYGPDHPFGSITTEASLKAITLDDCRAFAKTHLQPAAAKLFVVGDLTEAQIRAHFDKGALAGWKGKAGAVPALAKPKMPPGRIFLVHVPGAAQSQVSLLQMGPSRTAREFFANSMLAAVFGGSFTSRINMNLREDKGYSYGARGGFSYTRQYGAFTASASVRTDSTYQTLLEIDREVKELWVGKTPVTAAELEREKQGTILGLPGMFATAQAALGNYRRLVYFNLPLDYYDTYTAKAGAVTEADVKASAARELRPAQAVYLVVGDADANMIVHQPGTNEKGEKVADVPLLKDGHPVTLRAALQDLAASGNVGAGGLVELDVDGRPVGAAPKR